MTLLSKLEQLVKEEKAKSYRGSEAIYGYKTVTDDGYAPKEWSYLPANAEEGRKGILQSLIARQGWPRYVTDCFGQICFECGPVHPMPGNPNGYCHTSGRLDWVDVIENLVEARINEKLNSKENK